MLVQFMLNKLKLQFNVYCRQRRTEQSAAQSVLLGLQTKQSSHKHKYKYTAAATHTQTDTHMWQCNVATQFSYRHFAPKWQTVISIFVASCCCCCCCLLLLLHSLRLCHCRCCQNNRNYVNVREGLRSFVLFISSALFDLQRQHCIFHFPFSPLGHHN